MAVGRLPVWCGGRAATRVKKKQRVKLAGYSSFPSKTPAAQLAGGSGSKIVKSAGGGGGCYVNGNGALMMELGVGAGNKDGAGRRVMVVTDGRRRAEAADALQWALSQAVRSNDTLILLAVVKPAAEDVGDSCVKISRSRCYQHLDAMRKLCESTRSEVKVETCAVEGEERAPAVVEAARQHGVSLLVLGQQRQRAVTQWLQTLWRRRWRRRQQRVGGRSTTVEYCIEHAPCVALGVRRRSSGGYLVCSKRHKDFWLLA